jgi:hypothetical protein
VAEVACCPFRCLAGFKEERLEELEEIDETLPDFKRSS